MFDEFEELRGRHAARNAQEETLAREMGAVIGFGRMMQLGQQLWREQLVAGGLPTGGEFSIGPCVAFMVPCQCAETGVPAHKCEWCCGTKQVTKHVRAAINEQAALEREYTLMYALLLIVQQGSDIVLCPPMDTLAPIFRADEDKLSIKEATRRVLEIVEADHG